MSTKNIECQLAQGQIGRYLNGERFSPQAITQLEAHVADCDECSELVTRRRQALLTMLGERNSNMAVVNTSAMSAPKVEPMPVAEAAPQATPAAATSTAPQATKMQMFTQVMGSKPLLYCSGLAVVLLGMSYFSRGALKAFGPTADVTATAETHSTSKPATKKVAPVKVATVSIPKVVTPASTTSISTPAHKPATVHPAAVADNSDASDASDYSGSDENQTDTPVVAPVKHPAPARPIHRMRPVTRKTHRLVRASHRSTLRSSARLARRGIRIRARQITHRFRVAMNNRHRTVSRISHRKVHAPVNGIRIYDPQGRPLQ